MKLRPFWQKKNVLKIKSFAYGLYVNEDTPITVSVRNFTYDPDTKECRFSVKLFDVLNHQVEIPEHLRDELHRDIMETLMKALAGTYDESRN